MERMDARLQVSLKAMGFTQLTEVQKESFAPALAGKNLLVRAPTGTGKTAAFLVPIIQRMFNDLTLKALVIEPSRELAVQAANECRKIVGTNGILVVAAYGGTSPARQDELVAMGARIIIGTPGRIKEMLSKGVLKPSLYAVLVLDEADRLFQGEFSAATSHIASRLPKKRQTMLFCVQMPTTDLSHATKLFGELEPIKVGKVAQERVTHFFVVAVNKNRALAKLVKANPVKTIVFCASSLDVEQVRKELRYNLVNSLALHSELDSKKRHSAVRRFAQGGTLVLVASDLAARGMHFALVKRVYSVGVPAKKEFYLHRAGRTGRIGESGMCISVVTKDDLKQLRIAYENLGVQAKEMASPE